MNFYTRQKRAFLGWWRSVDQPIFYTIATIIAISAIMVATASTAVAERIGLEPFYFIKRQLAYLIISFFVILMISSFSIKELVKFSTLGFCIFIILMILVLFIGPEIKGATRWINLIGGISLQPSEFIKPFFVIINAIILSQNLKDPNIPTFKYSLILYFLVAGLLILQPDFGMTITITVIWCGQLFLAGLKLFWIIIVSIFVILGAMAAYTYLPHVADRINNFLNEDLGDNYQIKKSLEAFANGGFFGKGPGEGVVKQFLPDSHTDFIFAVIGEELGMITCFIVICLFCFVVIRGFTKILNDNNLFVVYSSSGLLMQFGIQSIINMGVALKLLPTKGMTLPFISYGGSSVIAISVSVGMILALTRKRFGLVYNKIEPTTWKKNYES